METVRKNRMDVRPMISVIVPAYNTQDYLLETLVSIVSQTYKNIEIIVIDDGSTDSTGRIADDFANSNVDKKIYVFHKENTGVLDSRIFGAKKAKGQWIAFVDSDDYIEPYMYEKLLENALKYKADISHCGFQIVVNKGERIRYFHNTGKLMIQNHREGVDSLISGQVVEPSVCNKLYKASLFKNVFESEWINKDIKHTEDLLMNYILFSSAVKSVFEDICPYHYNARANSASRSGTSFHRVFDPIKVYELILSDADNDANDVIIQRYLSCLINVLYKTYAYKKYSKYQNRLRNKLLKYKGKWRLLRKADKIKLCMLLYSPNTFNVLYQLYCRYFQKKEYE